MSTPQFSTAQYQQKPATDVCKFCGQSVGGTYFRVGDAMACGSCAEKARREGAKDTHAAFMRAVLFGIVGAILGLILYSAFAIITGLIIGYISLAVGYIVAKAMMLGSKGIGGRKYQVVAVILTYAAVSMSAIPIAINFYLSERKSHPPARVLQQVPSDRGVNQPAGQPKQQISFGAALFQLALLGLASPFLNFVGGISGMIGLIILMVGIRIAWKIAEGKSEQMIYGPFANSSPAG
jgi:hypothetical protein